MRKLLHFIALLAPAAALAQDHGEDIVFDWGNWQFAFDMDSIEGPAVTDEARRQLQEAVGRQRMQQCTGGRSNPARDLRDGFMTGLSGGGVRADCPFEERRLGPHHFEMSATCTSAKLPGTVAISFDIDYTRRSLSGEVAATIMPSGSNVAAVRLHGRLRGEHVGACAGDRAT